MVVAAGIGLLVTLGTGFWWPHWQLIDLHVYMGAAHNLLIDRMPYDVGYPPVHLDATYPPFGLLVISPLSVLPFTGVAVIWLVANWLVLTAVVSAVFVDVAPQRRFGADPRWRWALSAVLVSIAVVVMEPVRSDFSFGQINILLMGLVALDCIRPRNRLRGVALGVAAAVKFTPLIFVVLLVVRRDWRAVARTGVTFLAVTGAAWILRPAASARYFLQFRGQAALIGPPSYVSNQSWSGILARLHLHSPTWGVLWVLLCLVTVGVLVTALWPLVRHGNRTRATLLTALAGLLIAPISWTHHWVWVALAPVLLLATDLPRSLRRMLVCWVAVSVLAPYWWWTNGVLLGPLSPVLNDSLALVGAATLAAAAWQARRSADPVPLPADLVEEPA